MDNYLNKIQKTIKPYILDLDTLSSHYNNTIFIKLISRILTIIIMKRSPSIITRVLLGLCFLIAFSSFVLLPRENNLDAKISPVNDLVDEALCNVQLSNISLTGPGTVCGEYPRTYKAKFNLKSPTVNARVRVTFFSPSASVSPRVRNFVHEWSTCVSRTYSVTSSVIFPNEPDPTNTYVKATIYVEAYNSVGTTSATVTRNVLIEDFNTCD